MKKFHLLLTVVLVALFATSVFSQDHKMHMEKAKKSVVDLKKIDVNKDGKVFQCTMCADQVSDKPGECAKCGMKLKEFSLKEAEEHLKKHKGHMMKDMDKEHHHMKHEMEKDMHHMHGKIDVDKLDANKDGKLFQCTMCADQVSDKPGECAKCGMKLKEFSKEDVKKHLMKMHKK